MINNNIQEIIQYAILSTQNYYKRQFDVVFLNIIKNEYNMFPMVNKN